MQIRQLRARFDPELVAKSCPHRPKRRQGVRLPPGAVQRQHPLRLQVLPQWLCIRERVQFGEHRRMTPERKFRVDLQLGRPPAQLIQPAADARHKVESRQIGQKRPAPQRQGVVEVRDAVSRHALPQTAFA
jgi:hypothetical protein